MKKLKYVLVAVVIASCSGPKYTASFKSYEKNLSHNYDAATKSQQTIIAPDVEPIQLLASTAASPVVFKHATKEETGKTYLQMTKGERKELRQQLQSEVKSFVKVQKKNLGVESGKATAAMDKDLKMAAIFGAVGFVAMAIGGDLFWIVGGIALIIGVVFLVKWLVRQ